MNEGLLWEVISQLWSVLEVLDVMLELSAPDVRTFEVIAIESTHFVIFKYALYLQLLKPVHVI